MRARGFEDCELGDGQAWRKIRPDGCWGHGRGEPEGPAGALSGTPGPNSVFSSRCQATLMQPCTTSAWGPRLPGGHTQGSYCFLVPLGFWRLKLLWPAPHKASQHPSTFPLDPPSTRQAISYSAVLEST